MFFAKAIHNPFALLTLCMHALTLCYVFVGCILSECFNKGCKEVDKPCRFLVSQGRVWRSHARFCICNKFTFTSSKCQDSILNLCTGTFVQEL